MDLCRKNHELGQDCHYEHTVQRAHWAPLTQDTEAEVLVVGGGLAGLSCALELAEQGRSVVLLEGDRLCSQASGRNGGQAIAGFACGQAYLERQLGLPAARQLWALSLASLACMRERMARHGMDCEPVWSYLTVADRPRAARALQAEAHHMRTHYGHDMPYLEGAALREHIGSDHYVAGLRDPASGHINPLRYGLALAQAAQAAGAQLHEGSRVQQLQRSGGRWEALTSQACLRARQVVLAGNCGLLWQSPEVARPLHARIMPVGTYIIATEPLPAELASRLLPSNAAVCDNNFVLDYFRLDADRRLLFGGRVSYTTATPERLTESLRQRMLKVFPALAQARIEHTWGGFVDISRDRAPDWGTLEAGLFYLQGFSGHGVAATTLGGRVVARAVAGQPEELALFQRIRQAPFPGGPALRVPLLLLGTGYHRLMDWLR